jgi:hypothetical protein
MFKKSWYRILLTVMQNATGRESSDLGSLRYTSSSLNITFSVSFVFTLTQHMDIVFNKSVICSVSTLSIFRHIGKE